MFNSVGSIRRCLSCAAAQDADSKTAASDLDAVAGSLLAKASISFSRSFSRGAAPADAASDKAHPADRSASSPVKSLAANKPRLACPMPSSSALQARNAPARGAQSASNAWINRSSSGASSRTDDRHARHLSLSSAAWNARARHARALSSDGLDSAEAANSLAASLDRRFAASQPLAM